MKTFYFIQFPLQVNTLLSVWIKYFGS